MRYTIMTPLDLHVELKPDASFVSAPGSVNWSRKRSGGNGRTGKIGHRKKSFEHYVLAMHVMKHGLSQQIMQSRPWIDWVVLSTIGEHWYICS